VRGGVVLWRGLCWRTLGSKLGQRLEFGNAALAA